MEILFLGYMRFIMTTPAAFTPAQATKYIGIDSDTDALKTSRSTGTLWGMTAPRFCKAGTKKIIYLRTDLDEFLDQLEGYTNNAQVG